MAKQDILFVINPNSGRKRNNDELLENINKYLDTHQYRPIIAFTERSQHASELVKKHLSDGVKEFVAVGGDGTVNEVASELLFTGATLNIISKGSGNGLARHLGVYQSDEICIRRINGGVVSEIDAGRINGIPFLCTAGLGFDAFAAEKFSKTKGRGLRNYIKVGLQSYFSFEPIDILFDNSARKVFSITFGNASQFGNNAYITPDAIIDDGLLDCCIVNEHPKAAVCKLGIQLFNGTIRKSKYVEYFKAKTFEFKTKSLALIHYDGEAKFLDTDILKIEILEKALKVKL